MKNFKQILSIIVCTVMVLASSVLLTGCTYKKYKLVGIVDEANDQVVLMSEIQDQTIKSYLENNFGDAYIQLKSNGEYDFTRTVNADFSITETITQTGTYEIEEKVLKLTYVVSEDGRTYTNNTNQYINGKILYYDASIGKLLAFM